MLEKCSDHVPICIRRDSGDQVCTIARLLTYNFTCWDVVDTTVQPLGQVSEVDARARRVAGPSSSSTAVISQHSDRRRSAADEWAVCTALLVVE